MEDCDIIENLVDNILSDIMDKQARLDKMELCDNTSNPGICTKALYSDYTRRTALFNRLNHNQYGDPDAYGATFELARTTNEKRCQFSVIIARVQGKILAVEQAEGREAVQAAVLPVHHYLEKEKLAEWATKHITTKTIKTKYIETILPSDCSNYEVDTFYEHLPKAVATNINAYYAKYINSYTTANPTLVRDNVQVTWFVRKCNESLGDTEDSKDHLRIIHGNNIYNMSKETNLNDNIANRVDVARVEPRKWEAGSKLYRD